MYKTSYIANWRNFGSYKPVSIMAITPEYFKGKVLTSAAPPLDLFLSLRKGRISLNTYFARYREYLDSYGADRILMDIDNLDLDGLPVFLCTCKNYTKCHRSVFADFLNDYIKYDIEELPNTKDGLYLL